MNEYEMMSIIHPRLNADETAAAVTSIEEQIVANGGEMLSTDVWGRRRLAYPINHVNDGTYVLMTFKMPAQGTVPLERWLRISESVLRHMLIRGIIPFEGGRDEREDRYDREDRFDDGDDRDDRGERDEREAPRSEEAADTSNEGDSNEGDDREAVAATPAASAPEGADASDGGDADESQD